MGNGGVDLTDSNLGHVSRPIICKRFPSLPVLSNSEAD